MATLRAIAAPPSTRHSASTLSVLATMLGAAPSALAESRRRSFKSIEEEFSSWTKPSWEPAPSPPPDFWSWPTEAPAFRGTARTASSDGGTASGWGTELATEELLEICALILFIYGCLVALTRWRTKRDTVERATADRWLCCWQELYTGRSHIIYTILFGPFLLFFHACRIYLPTCLLVYFGRCIWLVFGCCRRNFFTDKEFPPNDESLGGVSGDAANQAAGKKTSSVKWVRAMDLGTGNEQRKRPKLHGTDMCLFQGKIEPQDIVQGALGDCWLLAAMATLSEKEGAINALFLTREVDPRGKYYVRLFDPQEKKWKVLVLDDFVPCEGNSQAKDGLLRGADGVPIVRFAKPNGSEIWAMVLEKAFAKLCGNYANIEGGITEWGIVCMTGGDAWRYENEGNTWSRLDLVAMEDDEDKRACGFRPSGEKHSSHQLFELLRYYHRNGAVLCCGGVKPAGEAKGLVAKHAFSLLQVVAARESRLSDKYFRFVQVRNPWGTGEWTGPWSDDSKEWEKYPYVKQKLGFVKSADDGSYWMQWEDFCEYWSYVGCVDCTTDIFSLRPPVYDETDRLGPLKGCLTGCFHYWCCCLGIQRYYWHHDATSEAIQAREFRRRFGADQRGLYCRVCEQETVRIEQDGRRVVVPVDPHEFRP